MKFRVIETPKASQSVRRQVESIKRQKIIAKKVVSLSDFRELKKNVDQRTILVVDDEEIMRNGLKRILEAEGYNVVLAGDGLELSKVLEASKLDLVLLDINLPWVDGYELCRIIKGHPALGQVPLVLVSARNSEEDIKKGVDAGCDQYVTKPFDVTHITNIISSLILKTG